MRAICAVMLVGLAIPGGAFAQAGRGAAPGPQVVSPQVNSNRSMTLRVLAPKATEISVTGEISPGWHAWRLWRPHLYEFAQLPFTDRKAGGTRPQ